MEFIIDQTDGRARRGRLVTGHGTVQTPAFMPVGTRGTVKAVSHQSVVDSGAEIILSNTYHLYLRPGVDILEQAGGLHRFMSWDRPILTDSGGYQVFSLTDLRTLSEDGVTFRSHIDGSQHSFTPEGVIDIQRSIGSDIMMVLDECTPYPCDKGYARLSNERTVRWSERCRRHFGETDGRYGYSQALFGIVQGSIYHEIRSEAVAALTGIGFDGYAIGGLAVGEPVVLMYEIVDRCTGEMPREHPRYLMGVGTPANILESIGLGIDMFDCVLPTRNARNAMLFTAQGPLSITNAVYKSDFAPPDEHCGCYTCAHFSRSYLRHLFQVREMLGPQLATIHNLSFYQWLMRGAREAIGEGRFGQWKRTLLTQMSQEVPAYS